MTKQKCQNNSFHIYFQQQSGLKWGGGILAYVNFRLKENCCIKLEEKEIESLWLDIFPFN